jgi:hypothetical protein
MLNLHTEPLSAEERALTGGKMKVVAKEVRKPFSASSVIRTNGRVERALTS